jgi:hypothetical protein
MQWYLMHELMIGMDLIGIPDILAKMTFVVYFPWIRIFMYTPNVTMTRVHPILYPFNVRHQMQGT